jgi:hypothetical protein
MTLTSEIKKTENIYISKRPKSTKKRIHEIYNKKNPGHRGYNTKQYLQFVKHLTKQLGDAPPTPKTPNYKKIINEVNEKTRIDYIFNLFRVFESRNNGPCLRKLLNQKLKEKRIIN